MLYGLECGENDTDLKTLGKKEKREQKRAKARPINSNKGFDG